MAEFFLFIICVLLILICLLLWTVIDKLISIDYILTDSWLKAIKVSEESQDQSGKK